jgi:Domain of unknown function (DUF7014)/AbiJ N-terminal domain 4
VGFTPREGSIPSSGTTFLRNSRDRTADGGRSKARSPADFNHSLTVSITDLFSKRQRRARGEVTDVYQYENLPEEFRAQVVHILKDLFGDPNRDASDAAFRVVHDALCREYGRFRLSERDGGRLPRALAVFDFLMTASTEEALDTIELAFNYGSGLATDGLYAARAGARISGDDAIAELNRRFREKSIGYQFESGEIVRVDSAVLHAQAVKPALYLLSDRAFAGANEEFLKAHEHHRHGRQQECMNECLKALESTLKIICKLRKWPYRETDTAKTLIDVVFANHLVPDWLQSEFSSLRSTLESGVPTGRNRSSGHGQGAAPREVPAHLAAYILHMTATAIVFLVESHKA